LADDSKSALFEHAHGIALADSRKPRHDSDEDFLVLHGANVRVGAQFFAHL
jgi:hypothetical protein